VGEKPAQEGFNEKRGVLIGLGIRGSRKNDRHPNQNRQPKLQKTTHKKVSIFRRQLSRRKTPAKAARINSKLEKIRGVWHRITLSP
jgi:hypothetical protein